MTTYKPKVYTASPISTEGDALFADEMSQQLRSLGYEVYSPIEDKSINDKSNDPTPQQIFVNDLDGINYADIIVVNETGREQVGTHVELGIVLERVGMQTRLQENGLLHDVRVTITDPDTKEMDSLVFRVVSEGRYGEIHSVLYTRELPKKMSIELEVHDALLESGTVFLLDSLKDMFPGKEVTLEFTEAEPPLVVMFTSNNRLNQPQIKYGMPSASMNHLALGGVLMRGKLVKGMFGGLLTYLLSEYRYLSKLYEPSWEMEE